VENHVKLTLEETHSLIECLQRAIEVGQATDNLDLQAMAEPLIDLIIDKWLKRGER
jgi:hypothetical protein